jgi:hypothetical protein
MWAFERKLAAGNDRTAFLATIPDPRVRLTCYSFKIVMLDSRSGKALGTKTIVQFLCRDG